MNFPVRPVTWLLRFLIQLLGASNHGPSDRITALCAGILTKPGLARDRLTVELFKPTRTAGKHLDGVFVLERAFSIAVAVQPIRDRMNVARVSDVDQAVEQRTITAEEAAQVNAAAMAVSAAVAVDDFAPEELASRGAAKKGDVSSQARSQSDQPASRLRAAAAE